VSYRMLSVGLVIHRPGVLQKCLRCIRHLKLALNPLRHLGLTDERKKVTKHLVDQRSDETPQLNPQRSNLMQAEECVPVASPPSKPPSRRLSFYSNLHVCSDQILIAPIKSRSDRTLVRDSSVRSNSSRPQNRTTDFSNSLIEMSSNSRKLRKQSLDRTSLNVLSAYSEPLRLPRRQNPASEVAAGSVQDQRTTCHAVERGHLC
jgi:hypothetical protein